MDEIRISSGKRTVNVVRDGENIGQFSFNPKNLKEAQRYSEVMLEMETKKVAYLKRAKEIDKTGDIKEKVVFLAEYVEDLRKDIDKIYGEGTSKFVFGDALDIDMIFEFIEGLAPYYKQASMDRISKYKNSLEIQS